MDSMTVVCETLQACPICGSGNFKPYLSHVEYGVDALYSHCEDCGIIFLNPRMTDPQTKTYYEGAYRTLLFGDRGVNRHEMQTQYQRTCVQVNLVGKRLPPIESHLDIGSSAGFLLEAFGAQVTQGIEPDVRYHSIHPARKHAMARDISEVPPGSYDLITMSHVLEHLNHPLEYLMNLHQYAHPETRLMVEVPDADNNAAAFLIHHPFAFTHITLDSLLARAGWNAAVHFKYNFEGSSNTYLLVLYDTLDH